MSKTIEWWCDSGANIHSCNKGSVTTEEIGISDQEWDDMTEEDKDELMRDFAFDRLDWGYREKE